MNNKTIEGHFSAIITILVWGTTFISTKVLLRDFIPIEILFFRFLIGFIILSIACPHIIKIYDKKTEMLFIGAGFSGITLYYLLENVALTYSTASNIGVIISAAPFFTGILSSIFLKEEKLKINFFVGFILAMIGICMMSFNEGDNLSFNIKGDVLALLAAAVWAVYSILTRKIASKGYGSIESTKKIFLYGLIFMIPILKIFDFKFGIYRFMQPVNLGNILFLGLGASALCFVTWNVAVKYLGPVKTSVYIYMVPVITVITSVLILKEEITLVKLISIFITIVGLFISESDFFNVYEKFIKCLFNKKLYN